MISRDTIIYTAALIDGEGSIQINPSTSAGKSKKKYWGLSLQVSSGCYEVLSDLCLEWDLGGITTWHPRGGRKDRTSNNWRIYSTEAEQVLRETLPFLRIKKENAELALEFRQYVASGRGGLTPEMSAKRTEIALALRELNQRYGKGILGNANVIGVL